MKRVAGKVRYLATRGLQSTRRLEPKFCAPQKDCKTNPLRKQGIWIKRFVG
jgi:hypothetical protein